ncbi:DUF3349 domain-containing protein [Micromonospora sp. NPDC023888]|uniref:DUF3349 domain-containing protein n=1 Tax=Micromonospora sp. NPDC023888 TaxID=3155607 RepID=UPI0033D87A2E
MLPPHLVPVLKILRLAYPGGPPDRDYLPLLAALQADLCESNLAAVVAELVDGEAAVVDNDAAAAASTRRPPPQEVERVRRLLISAGYAEEDLYPQDW